ncbi:MAG TPA: heavy metal-binding domain-containing protein [Burkholderiales bacterium]|nr:heavy metal-binding domain-containing protein [Burkholderiales bacterium]
MAQSEAAPQVYICPMHRNVRQGQPGKCPQCGMDLLPEGTRFGMLRHMVKSPIMLVAMAIVMIGIMMIAMKLM